MAVLKPVVNKEASTTGPGTSYMGRFGHTGCIDASCLLQHTAFGSCTGCWLFNCLPCNDFSHIRSGTDCFHCPLFFLAPFVIYPFASLYVSILVLILLYFLCYAGFRGFLRDFPWNTRYWKIDAVEEFRKQSLRQLGWPFKFLKTYDDTRMSFFEAILLSLLLTWWLHVIRWIISEPYHPGLLSLLAFLVAFLRIVVYGCIYRPPISLMGRIFTGRLIIPRYDKIFIAPICILLAGILLPLVLDRYGLMTVWNFEICFFFILLLAFSLPPRLNEWRLTGAYRTGGHVQSLRPKPPSPQDEKLAEFFSAKIKSVK